MSMIIWSDEYSLDIQEIDEQHKCIVNYINELYAALAGKNNQEQLTELLHKLVEYTKIHFAVEETLMRIFNYRDYSGHKQSHDRIVHQVLVYQKRFLAGDSKVGMELLMFLKGWLFEHINKEDKHYTDTFLAAGVKKKWLSRFW